MEERHQTHKRTSDSVVHDAPLERHDHHHKRTLLFAGVVMSMVIVLGLYAASFRYRDLSPVARDDVKRWGAMQEEFFDDSTSLLDGFREVTDTVTGVLNANKVRAQSIEIMKGKIAGTATSTDPTEAGTNTPETGDAAEDR